VRRPPLPVLRRVPSAGSSGSDGTPSEQDAGVAMVFVVCALVMAMIVTVGLLGALFSEMGPTTYERKSERTIAGSQAGLQVGLAALRQAWTTRTGTVNAGDLTKLPCYTSSAPLVGQVGGLQADQAPVGYKLAISYYTVSPVGQSAGWRATNALPCTTGAGPSATPVYALVQALGYADVANVPTGWGDRGTEVVYTFNRTDQAVLGGQIHNDLRTSSSTNLCWTAATYPATAGTAVKLATCTASNPAQTWSYRTDYSIVLSATQSATSPGTGGLCVNTDLAGATTTTSTVTITPAPTTSTYYSSSTYTYTYNNGNTNVKTGTYTTTLTTTVTPPATTTTTTGLSGGSIVGLSLQPCQSGAWSQLWAYDDAGDFRGVNQTKTSLSNQCISSGGNYAVDAQLTVQTCGWFTWTPEASVGAGAAGPLTTQLVNYGEYGRCLDVTEWNLGAAWLIDYPCKQDPTSAVGWNQRWTYDGAGTRQIITNSTSGAYCLTTPTTAGGYVLTRPCDGTRADQRWTRLGDTGNRSTSYTYVDGSGRCLSLGPPGPAANYLSAWSSITADTCDGSYRQKWNAPPLPSGGNLAGERETTGGR
jgi:hypothetical protein